MEFGATDFACACAGADLYKKRYAKMWREQNKERIAQYNQRYWLENKERLKARRGIKMLC